MRRAAATYAVIVILFYLFLIAKLTGHLHG